MLDAGFRTQLWNRLAKDKPKVANPTARTGTIASAFIGLCRSKAFGDAMGLVGKYNIDDIIDVLLIAHAAGMLRELEAHWGDAKGIDTARLRAAVGAIRLQGVLAAIGAASIPVGDVVAKATKGKLDAYEKDLDKVINDPNANATSKEKCQNTKDILNLARNSVTQLASDSAALSKEDLASLNRFIGGAATNDFTRVINSPEANAQGQFVLSTAVSNTIYKVIDEQLKRFGPLDADLEKRITTANDALTAAIGAVNPGDARSSYGRVDLAAGKLRGELAAIAKVKGKPLTADTNAVLKVALPVPPVKTSYADVLSAVWMPLWKKWIDTKTFPDLSGARNVYKLAYLRMADLWACQPMAMKLVELYDARATGADVRAKDPKFAFGPVPVYQSTKLIKDKDGLVSETVKYRPDLGQRVEQMRQALDHGWFVHVRVMSGVKMDYTSSRAAGEHSLMVVGYRGNAFMCSDTDPGGEGAAHHMTGYAGLFYDPEGNTLGSGVGPGLEVDDGGMQGNHRHRYQAWTIASR